MRILVTGGAGFIGTHVMAALADAGHEPVVLDRRHHPAGDIRDRATVEAALRGVDAVVHQAAMVGMGVNLDDLPEYASHNDLGTAVLLAAMARAGVRRLVLASSMVVYGEGANELAAGRFEPRCPRCAAELSPALVEEDAPLRPRSVYAATKVAQEHLTDAWARGCGATAVALRYHNVYGPGMPRDTPYAGVAAIFRSSLERGEAPRVFEDGGQRRDFVHVRDVARANVAALTVDVPVGLHAYNIASGHPRTVGDLARALSTALRGPEPVVTGQFRAGDVRHVTAAPGRAARELGFTAAVPFDAGVAELATATLR
jgi:dTDP-L-rhamnose 4-epimerase